MHHKEILKLWWKKKQIGKNRWKKKFGLFSRKSQNNGGKTIERKKIKNEIDKWEKLFFFCLLKPNRIQIHFRSNTISYGNWWQKQSKIYTLFSSLVYTKVEQWIRSTCQLEELHYFYLDEKIQYFIIKRRIYHF